MTRRRKRPTYRELDGKQSPSPGLADFVGDEIVRAVAGLTAKSFVGPWPTTLRGRLLRRPFPPTFLPEGHAHPHVELCQLLAGRCALSYRFRHYLLSEGDLGFFPPNVEHAETFYDARTPYRLAWWVLSGDAVVVHVTGYSRSGGFRMVDRVVLDPPGQEARDAARRLARFCLADEPPPVLPVKEAMLTLAVSVLRRAMAESSTDRSRARRAVIDHVERYVRERPDRAVSIGEVARHVVLSPNYLTTLFREETGTSLGSHIKRQRIERAKRMLTEGDRSVKEVAFALGFEDPFAFSRAFRQTEGVSPVKYRSIATIEGNLAPHPKPLPRVRGRGSKAYRRK